MAARLRPWEKSASIFSHATQPQSRFQHCTDFKYKRQKSRESLGQIANVSQKKKNSSNDSPKIGLCSCNLKKYIPQKQTNKKSINNYFWGVGVSLLLRNGFAKNANFSLMFTSRLPTAIRDPELFLRFPKIHSDH